MSDRSKWLYGKAVVDGKPRFLSVSRLSGADERENGCLRSWWYTMVGGRKKPSTRASKRGDDLHAELEKYLKTGDRSLSSLALGGMHMVPERGDDLLIEHDLLRRPRDAAPEDGLDLTKPDQLALATERANVLLANAPLTAAGIPVLGRMDLVHGRGTNKGVPNIEETLDPPNTVEVLDWKSTGSPDWIKRPKDLPDLIQMAGYAEWVYRVEPAAEQVRLSHAYFVERGGPSRKVSLRVVRDLVAKTWEHAEGVARSIRDAAPEVNPDLIDANTNACDAYGGCYHREVCKARMHKSLSAFIGVAAANQLISNQTQETPKMGLLDMLKSQAGQATATTAPSAPAGLAGLLASNAPAPAATQPQPDPAAARAALEAEEAQLRAAAQLREQADRIAPIVKLFVDYAAVNPIGVPTYSADAAKAVAAATGATLTAEGTIPGSGTLGEKVNIDTIAAAEDLVKQFAELVTAGQIKAPASPIASSPLAGLAALTADKTPEVMPQTPTTTQAAPLTSPTSSGSAAPAGQPTELEKPADAPAGGKKRTAKKADGDAKANDATTFNLFVDAIAEFPSAAFKPFAPIFDALCAELAAQTNDLDLRAAGLRGVQGGGLTFDKDSSPFAFGRAEGALAALLRERDIAPGYYTFDTRGNRLAEVAADALREKCRKTGGVFVWGRR